MALVPSLTNSLYLTDPKTIIVFQLRKYFRTPDKAVPVLGDMIISLPLRAAQYGNNPEQFIRVIESDLQAVYNRIFETERKVAVNAIYTLTSSNRYDVTISVSYIKVNGDPDQLGTDFGIDENGRLIIPEDNLYINDQFFG